MSVNLFSEEFEVKAIKLVLFPLPMVYLYGTEFETETISATPPIGVIVTLKASSFGVDMYRYCSNGAAGPEPVEATGGM